MPNPQQPPRRPRFIPTEGDAVRAASENLAQSMARISDSLGQVMRRVRSPYSVHVEQTERLLIHRWAWWVRNDRNGLYVADGFAFTESRARNAASAKKRELDLKAAANRAGIRSRSNTELNATDR